MLNKLHLNSVHCTQGGMYVTGLKTGGMLLYNGKQVQMAAELPPGTHNARPFRDGVLFNDTEADALRYAGRGEGREDRALKVPRYDPEELLNRDLDTSRIARQGFARGSVRAVGLGRGGRLVAVDRHGLRPRGERTAAVGQPDDGCAQRHPRPRRLALRLIRAVIPRGGPRCGPLPAARRGCRRAPPARGRGTSRSAASSRARRCRWAAVPARSSRSSLRACSRGSARTPPRTAARSARGCAAPASRGR